MSSLCAILRFVTDQRYFESLIESQQTRAARTASTFHEVPPFVREDDLKQKKTALLDMHVGEALLLRTMSNAHFLKRVWLLACSSHG